MLFELCSLFWLLEKVGVTNFFGKFSPSRSRVIIKTAARENINNSLDKQRKLCQLKILMKMVSIHFMNYHSRTPMNQETTLLGAKYT